ncbi:MAG: hypothetical protein V3V16_14940 [Melioribacteraceae bacterium]
MKKLITLITLFFVFAPIFAQGNLEKSLSGYTNPDELVTISEFVPFGQAIEILSKLSVKHSGKKIISSAGFSESIGVQIEKIQYLKALGIIVRYNNLEYEERESVILVRKKVSGVKNLAKDIYAPIDSREVKISAIFFEADVFELQERGINWEWLLKSDGVSLGTKLNSFTSGQELAEKGTQQTVKPLEYVANAASDFTSGSFTGTVEGVFKYFESENLGEIISRPKLIVRDGMQGNIQIGSDISIKQRDFSGNIIDKFYATGTIIDVIPTIYTEDGIDYMLLKIKAERSSAIPGEITTEIKKTTVETDLMMLSGEEKVIGGLFINEEIYVRQGIPFLKDLPWWVFGIRYLTGYDKIQINKKEIIILLKAELVPTLKERVALRKENLINREIVEDHEELRKYKMKPFRDEEIKTLKELNEL